MKNTNSTCYCSNGVIKNLIAEEKFGPDKKGISELSSLRGSIKESKTPLNSSNGNRYKLIINNVGDTAKPFSIILTYQVDQENYLNLLRYDGWDNHKNHIENVRIRPGTHFHRATERYQRSPVHPDDGYAEPTDRWNNAREALQCMINDCNIIFEDDSQLELL